MSPPSFSLDAVNFLGNESRMTAGRRGYDLASTMNGNNISRITGVNNYT
jgi:hypothetical protein